MVKLRGARARNRWWRNAADPPQRHDAAAHRPGQPGLVSDAQQISSRYAFIAHLCVAPEPGRAWVGLDAARCHEL